MGNGVPGNSIICAKGHQPTVSLDVDLKYCIWLRIMIIHKPNKS